MARRLRSDLPDGVFHVTARGVARTPIFRDGEDRRFFLRLLLGTVARHAWYCHALCLMSNHYHLVVGTTRAALSAGLQRLNGVYALDFNARHRRSGHLFGDRFWSEPLEDEEHYVQVCRYVVANPVRAGLCARASDWPWSASRYGLDAQ